MAPPVVELADVSAALREKLPPVPDVPEPIENDMDPPAPPLASPVVSENSPELPLDVVPDFMVTEPLTPEVPAFCVWIAKLPLDVADPAPVAR